MDKKGNPRTGDGRKGGQKPKPQDCKMVTRNGYATASQPKGWTAKVINLFKGQ